ncbi:hypothetical protein WJX84_004311 [Apatococcus fuscideae]|uniref:Uncharacterized protein n=1 Tax=Apatococcus fuscideae TaxID=2026836 RepID=A0AAW1T4H7_9CHLO
MYRVGGKWVRKLGGGEGFTGVYGTMGKPSTKKVMDALVQHTGMNRHSKFLDVGAGLGLPQMHAALDPGVERARGFEIDAPKVAKGRAVIKKTFEEMGLRGALPAIIHKDIADVQHVDDTHIFGFWQGINEKDKRAFAKAAAADKNLKGMAVVQHATGMKDPAKAMEELGFPRMTLKASFPVKMNSRGFTAYIFRPGAGGGAGDLLLQQPDGVQIVGPGGAPAPPTQADGGDVGAAQTDLLGGKGVVRGGDVDVPEQHMAQCKEAEGGHREGTVELDALQAEGGQLGEVVEVVGTQRQEEGAAGGHETEVDEVGGQEGQAVEVGVLQGAAGDVEGLELGQVQLAVLELGEVQMHVLRHGELEGGQRPASRNPSTETSACPGRGLEPRYTCRVFPEHGAVVRVGDDVVCPWCCAAGEGIGRPGARVWNPVRRTRLWGLLISVRYKGTAYEVAGVCDVPQYVCWPLPRVELEDGELVESA